MKTRILALCIALWPLEVLLADWSDPERGKPVLLMYSARDFGTEAMNWSVVVDRKGRLYLGNDRVQEFDGRTWKNLPFAPGKRSALVRAMDLDADGRLWVAGNDEFGYFDEDEEGRRQFHSLRSFVPTGTALGEIWHLFCTGNKVIFSNRASTFIWDGRQILVHSMPNESRICLMRVGKEVWISHPGQGLFRWDGVRIAPIDTSEPAKEMLVWASLLANGEALLGSRSGVLRYQNGKLHHIASPLSSALKEATQVSAVQLPNGETWIITLFGGIFILDSNGAPVRVLHRGAGLPRHPLTGFWLQPNGALWVTSTHSLLRLETQTSRTFFDAGLGFDAGAMRVAARVERNITLLGAEDGVLRVMPAESWEKMARLEKIPGPNRLHWAGLTLDDQSAVFAGSRGLSRVTAARSQPVYSGPKDTFQIARVPGRRDLLIGLEGDQVIELSMRPDRSWASRSLIKLPNSGVDLQVDPRGRVWVSTWMNGVSMITEPWETDEPARRDLTPGLELPEEFARANFFQIEGRVFAFSATQLVELGDGPPRRIELPRSPEILLVEDNPVEKGPVWGVARWPGEPPRLIGLSATSTGLHCHVYPIDLLGPVEQPIGVARTEGSTIFWVSGSEGLLRVETSLLRPDEPPASPRLTRALWRTPQGEQALPLRAPQVVDFEEESALVLDFRAPGSPIEAAPNLEYRLGLAAPWSRFTGPLTLNGLHEGQHRVEVRTVSGPFPPSHPVEFALVIRPPWQRHPWAYFLYVVAGAAALAGAVSWRIRRIRTLNTRLQELVDRRTAELSRATAAKGALLSTLGHELLNPLNGVVGMAENLRHARLPPAEAEKVSRLASCAAQLSTVVEDVMEHARLEAGRVTLRLRPFALREPVEAALDIFRSIQSPGQSAIRIEADPALLDEIRIGAPDRIRHILVNYLSNALKFGAGKPVKLRVSASAEDPVEFAIEDQGPGIQEEERLLLFNRFTRSTHARRLGIPGTGLGLAACKAYAEAMGGEVGVDSRLGSGSTFYLRLPLARPQGATPGELVVSTDHLQGMIVLVIDDHEFNREVLCHTLERLGAKPAGAADLVAARRLFLEKKPDLVLTDFDLGNSTGADFATWVRREAPHGRDIPIIATTAFELHEVRERCRQAGMDGFLSKPITEWKLREAVARIDRTRAGEHDEMLPKETPAPGMIDLLSGGDAKRRTELLNRARSECRTEVSRILRAQRRGDLSEVQRAAHRLVSVAVLLEWEALTRLVQAAHQAAQNNEATAVSAHAAEMRRLLRENSADWRRRQS